MAFGSDNTNTNFGGRERHGINNIFYILKETLPANVEGLEPTEGNPTTLLQTPKHLNMLNEINTFLQRLKALIIRTHIKYQSPPPPSQY